MFIASFMTACRITEQYVSRQHLQFPSKCSTLNAEPLRGACCQFKPWWSQPCSDVGSSTLNARGKFSPVKTSHRLTTFPVSDPTAGEEKLQAEMKA